MAHSNKVGLGSVRIPCRERPVLVEARGAGLVMSALHSAAKSARRAATGGLDILGESPTAQACLIGIAIYQASVNCFTQYRRMRP